MKNFLAKFVNAFSKEFSAEIARNPQLRSEVDHIKKKMEIFNFKIPPQKYIVHNRNINEFKPGPFISEKSFMKNKSWILSSSGILKSILNDYYKLSYIEDHLVDHVIIGGVKNINDIDKYNHSIKILGKGSKERIVFYGSFCEDALNLYIHDGREQLRKSATDYLFLNKNGTTHIERF